MASEAETLHFVTEESHVGKRADAVLAMLTGFSRNRVQQLISDGMASSISKSSEKMDAGQSITLTIPPSTALDLKGENIPLDILYDDPHLVIINKAAGMVVHPSAGHHSGTLVHALLYHYPDLPGINGQERPGIVHRLDKGTSGSMVIAKTETACRGLTHMFADHDLDRQYIAWIKGIPSWHQETIDAPIGRHPKHRQKMAVVHTGKSAVTDVTVEETFSMCSRVRLRLHTGRTHQIRVHLSHLGFPILGDITYGRKARLPMNTPEELQQAVSALKSQALHAEKLAFAHPVTQQAIECIAPWPEPLQQLNALLAKSSQHVP